MTICIVVLPEKSAAKQLFESLKEGGTPLLECKLVPPNLSEKSSGEKGSADSVLSNTDNVLPELSIDQVELLNPKLTRRNRQKSMSLWLMPFGFLAGLTFAKMTGLQTFENLGIGSFGEPIAGGLLGMGSGWLGSQVASASVNSINKDDLRSIKKLNEDGQWLLLLETPFEVEPPWRTIQEVNPIQVVRLSAQ